ncbi:MAG: TetR/AcrR family transcriptional regulator [Bacteroidota bacterium]
MPRSIEYRILEHAQHVFMRYGVRSITMDDLAKGLGISKKTIYQYYSNKADLVYEVSKAHFRQEEQNCEIAAQSAVDAIDEMVKVVKWSLEMFSNVAPNLIFEIQKYYPKAWDLFNEFREHFVLRELRKNLQRGIEEGLYRKNLNLEIVARMRIVQIDMSVNPEYFPPNDFPPVEVQSQMFETYIRGIVTEKGRRLLSKYLASSPEKIPPPATHSIPFPKTKSQEQT